MSEPLESVPDAGGDTPQEASADPIVPDQPPTESPLDQPPTENSPEPEPSPPPQETQPPPEPAVQDQPPPPRPVVQEQPPSQPVVQTQSKPQSQSASPSTKSAAVPMPETPQEKKAKQYIAEAEKKIKSSQGFFGSLFGGSAKKEEAADLYVRAANSFKVAKRSKAAGNAFRRAAEIHMEMDTKHEAASNLSEAGQVLKREDPSEAVKCYLQAVEIYTDMGRFSLAARYHSTVAEIYESELQEYDQAIANYERAADYFRGEDSIGSANKCLLKVAHMCATLQKFQKAVEIFETVGRNSLENTLLKYAAKEYFFKAAICNFCIEKELAKDSIISYKHIHPGFEGTRELKLIVDLLEAVEEGDQDKFADIVKEYDAISRIDPWLTAQLLHIKKAMTREDTEKIL